METRMNDVIIIKTIAAMLIVVAAAVLVCVAVRAFGAEDGVDGVDAVDAVETADAVENVEAIDDTEDARMLARLIYSEARGVPSEARQAAVVWCVLNRVDSGIWGDTIAEVVTYPHQFAYDEETPVYAAYEWLARDVLRRWRDGGVGRVLPEGYLYFTGDGRENYFTKEYGGEEYYTWDLPDVYEGGGVIVSVAPDAERGFIK